jgi:hypothetical protein
VADKSLPKELEEVAKTKKVTRHSSWKKN